VDVFTWLLLNGSLSTRSFLVLLQGNWNNKSSFPLVSYNMVFLGSFLELVRVLRLSAHRPKSKSSGMVWLDQWKFSASCHYPPL
jgi:hypothetical protein